MKVLHSLILVAKNKSDHWFELVNATGYPCEPCVWLSVEGK